MAKNDNLKDFLTDVANAIREKKGTTDLINPQDFSAEIASIKSGGGGGATSALAKAVNFRDYDGTILHSYTKDEFLALSELPPLPTREGLICQEWNWDYVDAVEYVTEYGVLEVGATYITDDGKTRLYITIETEAQRTTYIYFRQGISEGVSIDWGDGSAAETKSGTGNITASHTYQQVGDYVISLGVINTDMGFYFALGQSGRGVMGAHSGLQSRLNMLKKIEIGDFVTKIEASMLRGCFSLTHITIPKLSEQGNYIMNSCRSLKAVVLPNGIASLTTYGYTNCTALEFLIVPPSVVNIYGDTRSNCYALKKVIIPNGVTNIASYAFSYNQALSSVVFPKSIASIESNGFSYCTGVTIYDFSALESIPSLGATSAFSSIPSDCKIIVPDALCDEWIAATNWSTYASYIIKKSDWDALNA